MNYALDRNDRRARHAPDNSEDGEDGEERKSGISGLELDRRLAVSWIRGESENNTTKLDKEKMGSVNSAMKGHELLGRTLRDCGKCREAVFHYAAAWSYDPDNARAAGDYAQMAELAGFPEVGVLALLHYRAGGKLKKPPIPLYSIGANDDSGCGMVDCGREACHVPMLEMDLTVNSLSAYMNMRNNLQKSEIIMPKANHVLSILAKNKQQQIMPQEEDGSISSSVLRFWEDKEESNKNSNKEEKTDNKNTPMSSSDYSLCNVRSLELVLKLLLVKLLYVTIPSLAIEAVVGMNFDPKEDRRLRNQYKSHWAYYVLIRAVAVGKRIKPSRLAELKYYYPVPTWDLIWDLNHAAREKQKANSGEGDDRDSKEKVNENSISDDCDGAVSSSMLAIKNLEQALALATTTQREQSKEKEEHIENFSLISISSKEITSQFSSPLSLSSSPLPQKWWWQPSSRHNNDSGRQLRPIYILGDSHVLSLAWQTIRVPSPRLVVPLVVTGLKAWHTRKDTHFFTSYLLRASLSRIPRIDGNSTPHATTVLFSAGEIDCREGIGGRILEGYDQDCVGKEVERTVKEFVAALLDITVSFSGGGLQILLMPVAPHAHRSDRYGKNIRRAYRRRTTKVWNEELRRQLPLWNNDDNNNNGGRSGVYFLDYESTLLAPQQKQTQQRNGCSKEEDTSYYVLKPELDADCTHMNSAFLPHLEDAIMKCGCDLSFI